VNEIRNTMQDKEEEFNKDIKNLGKIKLKSINNPNRNAHESLANRTE
jgi:hypothetical protein